MKPSTTPSSIPDEQPPGAWAVATHQTRDEVNGPASCQEGVTEIGSPARGADGDIESVTEGAAAAAEGATAKAATSSARPAIHLCRRGDASTRPAYFGRLNPTRRRSVGKLQLTAGPGDLLGD